MNIIVEMGSIIIQISSNTDTLISHAAAFQSMNPDDSLADILSESAITAIVDKDKESNESYRPKLIYNDFEKKIKVSTSIVSELDKCESFDFSVAFITMGGITGLFQKFEELKERQVKGRIITTDYLNFSDPNALKWLLKNTDFEIRMYEKDSFHTKGYIFHGKDVDTMIIGSSNLTADALAVNKEWNLKLSSLDDGELLRDTISEFETMWSDSTVLTDEWIDDYIPRYKRARMERSKEIFTEKGYDLLQPNDMQKEALINLDKIHRDGKDRALLISATGTGKTYLSAFDVREFGAKKVLFLVHREQILKDAKNSYGKVLGSKFTYGILSGNSKDYNADMLFSTIQTMSKKEVMEHFQRDHFDYIVCDEAHHAFSDSYKRIIDYFRPKFMLGMTATPERMDGGDVFALFDHTIAYEIRLQKAMEQDMLCPFHYFGISDITVNGKALDDNTSFNTLISDERVKHILDKADYYSHTGGRVKGLIFCSRTDEARVLSDKMNDRGLRTLALSANNTPDEREAAVERLEKDTGDDCLDYILTVNIFNEGVDIPAINQILMLRPTESAIVFVQQLGRGLRKANNKDYVVIIDFIGNYTNNFLIPIAFSGDRSCNKDNARRYLISGNSIVPGCSSVNFDTITKDRIYDCINRTNLSKLATLKYEYSNMKVRLGRDPTLVELYENGSLDPRVVVDYSESLYDFRNKLKIATDKMSEDEIKVLRFVSTQFLNGKRPEELVILNEVVRNGKIRIEDLLSRGYSKKSIESAVSILTGGFVVEATAKKYPYRNLIVKRENKLVLSPVLSEYLRDLPFKSYFEDVIKCGLEINRKEYSDCDEAGFVLFSKYSRSDVCRILNWDKNEYSTIYGYRIKHNTCPIFVTYNKDEDISETTKYDDRFIDRNTFSWITRSRVKMDSPEVVAIRNYRKTGMVIPLFVKKADGEGTDFYYMGLVDPIVDKMKESETGGESVVNIPMKLRCTIDDSLFTYIAQ